MKFEDWIKYEEARLKENPKPKSKEEILDELIREMRQALKQLGIELPKENEQETT